MIKVIIFMLGIIISFIPKVNALENDSYIDWNLDRSVFVHQYKNGVEKLENLAFITANGKIAYCIEPGVMADKASYYNSTFDISNTPVSNTNLKKLSLIGYYGYGYNNHNIKEYYMASQELIWELMGVDDVWFTDSKYGGNIINVESYKNERLGLVNSYEITPKFDFKQKYIIGEQITLNDNNNVLNSYVVKDNNNVKIENNSIKIKVEENTNFKLCRNSNGLKPVFYYKSGYQTIGSFEYAYDFCNDYTIISEYGSIKVEKYDYDNKSKTPSSSYSTLKGATYALYDSNNNLIKEKTTDENGSIIFDNISFGKYFIKEIRPSIGYVLDNNIYEINLDSTNINQDIKSYEKVITNKIIINKVLDDKENGLMVPEENIEFGIYDMDNNLYNTYKTNKEGIISFNLPYGNYILKQLSSPDNVKKIDDVLIKVEEDNKINNMTLVNKKIEEEKVLPKTGKSINYIPFILPYIFFIITYIYEKKYI